MSTVIRDSSLMLNMANNYQTTIFRQSNTTKKLSTGYRINSAADDAAGLQISEKMRYLIRGLNRGTQNAQDGISLVQTADGALNEVHAMLQRMNELSIQAANDTNTDADRKALEAEFEEIQSEIDRVLADTEFNTKQVFNNHEENFASSEGGAVWQYDELHNITSTNNSLTVNYKDLAGGDCSTSITVAEGTYSTQELIDEIDTVMEANGLRNSGINLEYTKDGTCNLNVENGTDIVSVTGGLSYLLTSGSNGGDMGTLIGTTAFANDNSTLRINSQNNTMSFTIQNILDGSTKSKTLVLSDGLYTRDELIDKINESLAGTTVKAVAYEKGIKMYSDSAFITGFKGNMFKLDNFTSVFYDNINYGEVTLQAATLKGGAVLATDPRDADHSKYHIDSSNNQLVIRPNGANTSTTITLSDGDYTIDEMTAKLNSLFAASNLGLQASSYTENGYSGLIITSTKSGRSSDVGIDASSSAYNSLFKERKNCVFATTSTLTTANGNSMARYIPYKNYYSVTSQNPLIVTKDVDDEFNIKVTYNDNSQKTYTVKVAAGTYNSRAEMISAMNTALTTAKDSAGNTVDLSKQINTTTYSSSYLEFDGKKSSGIINMRCEAVAGNDGASHLLSEVISSNVGASSSSGVLTLNAKTEEPMKIGAGNRTLSLQMGSITKSVLLPTGDNVSRSDVINAINAAFTPETRITAFSTSLYGNCRTQSTTTGTGTESAFPTSYNVQGIYRSAQQGLVGQEVNTPATVTLRNSIDPTTVITSSNNTLKLTVNGQEKTITLNNGTYTREQLVNQIQSKLDAAFGTSYGGVKVSLTSDKKLSFEARLGDTPSTMFGDQTTIAMSTADSSFLADVESNKTAASVSTNYAIANSITLYNSADYSNNQFEFTYRANGRNQTVSLSLAAGTYTRSSFISAINNALKGQGVQVTASLDSSNHMVLTSDNRGSQYSLSFYQNTTGKNAKFLSAAYADTSKYRTRLNAELQNSITLDDSNNTMTITVAGKTKNVTIENGTYNSRSEFVSALNRALQKQGVLATASLDGNNLCFTSNVYGYDGIIGVSSATIGDSIRSAMYGTTDFNGATASFNSDGQLVLTSLAGSPQQMYVNSATGSIFQVPNKSERLTYTYTDLTTAASSLTSKNAIHFPITIDDYNRDLSFTYRDNAVDKVISIQMDKGTYTKDQFIQALDAKLEQATANGLNDFTVSVDASGKLSLSTFNNGNYYRLSNFFRWFI